MALALIAGMDVQTAAEQSAAVVASGPFTIRQWRELPERERKISIITGIEGTLLSAVGPRGGESGVDAICMSTTTIERIEKGLDAMAATSDDAFVMDLVEASGCAR